jgi:hypothetical protein
VTIPCRSESGSFAKATRNRSLSPTSPAMAHGLEQSIRILPSWSTVMKAKRGSTTGFTTFTSRPYSELMGSQ